MVIGYVLDKISISNDREKNIPRRIRITLISDVMHVLTIRRELSFLILYEYSVEYQLSVLQHKK